MQLYFLAPGYLARLTQNNQQLSASKFVLRACLISCIFLTFVGIISYPTNANAAEEGMNIALVLDTSGSMVKNDPNQLRIQAAKLFVSLLSAEDKVSLVGFDRRATPVTPLLNLNTAQNEKKILSSIEKLSANGQLSNLHDALLRGYKLLKSSKSGEKHIILMSDGKMDLGNKEVNLRLLEKTLDELTPKLSKENIKVHTIAFTPDSYIPLLKLAAEDTRGQFVMLDNANKIHQVFEKLFERTKSPEMLPLNEDSFVVDKSVDELTIVASKFHPNSKITLESPDGTEISLDNKPNNIKWFKARKFDLITIKKPKAGYWLIKYSEGGNKAYIASDIKLDIESTKYKANPGAPLHIQASLTKRNKKIKNKSILASTRFTAVVTSPTGAQIVNVLKDDGSEIGSERKDGVFGISYAFDKQGPYKIEITAQGETFDRKKSLFVEVKSTDTISPFTLQQDRINQPDMIDAAINQQGSPAQMPGQNATASAAITAETDSANQPNEGMAKENDISKGLIPGIEGIDQNLIDTPDTEQDSETLPDEDEESKTEEELTNEELNANSQFGIKDAVIAFISFNVFLLGLGGAYYAWYRHQQRRKDKDAPSDTKEDKNNIDSVIDGVDSSPEEIDSSPDSGIDLESEESLTTTISDIDLEDELSSILDNENDDK